MSFKCTSQTFLIMVFSWYFIDFFVATGKEGSLLRKSWLMLVYRKASPIYMTIFICPIDTIILLAIKILK